MRRVSLRQSVVVSRDRAAGTAAATGDAGVARAVPLRDAPRSSRRPRALLPAVPRRSVHGRVAPGRRRGAVPRLERADHVGVLPPQRRARLAGARLLGPRAHAVGRTWPAAPRTSCGGSWSRTGAGAAATTGPGSPRPSTTRSCRSRRRTTGARRSAGACATSRSASGARRRPSGSRRRRSTSSRSASPPSAA